MGLLDAVEEFGDALVAAGKGIAQVFNPVGPLGNPIPVIGALSTLDDVIEAGSRVVDWVKGGSDNVRRTANSPILQGGQLVIAGMRRTTGTGEPDHGDQFGHGSNGFREASQVSATAEPTDDWTGSGADAYAGQNGQQRGRAMTMADLDREVQTVIAREAFQIDFHRGKLDDQSNWLADVGVATLKLGRVIGVGPAMTAALETQAVIAAVGSSSMELAALSDEVSTNAAAVRVMVGLYDEVARSVSSSGPMSPPPPEGPGDDPADPSPDGESTTGHPSDEGPTDTPPSGTSAPSSGGGGGTPAVNGPSSAAAPAAPNMTLPTLPQAPMSGGGPAASGGMPGALGALPSALGGAPAGPGAGGAASALGPLIQAAVQRAFDQQSAEEKAGEDEQKRADRDDEQRPGQDDEHLVEDGVPVAAEDAGAVAASGTGERGRAPVHVELDVDPERLHDPMTVTLDRHRLTMVPPTPPTLTA